MGSFIEIAYLRMREIVILLERELEEAEMVAYYACDPDAAANGLYGSRTHHEYMAQRARTALMRARSALAQIQVLAYERGLAVELPEYA